MTLKKWSSAAICTGRNNPSQNMHIINFVHSYFAVSVSVWYIIPYSSIDDFIATEITKQLCLSSNFVYPISTAYHFEYPKITILFI